MNYVPLIAIDCKGAGMKNDNGQVRLVTEHPQKVRVVDIPNGSHRADEGWINMKVQWVITKTSGGSESSVFGITTFPPGSRHDIHRHKSAEEIEYLISGEGIARIGDADVAMVPGDVVIAKKNESHGFWNTSATEDAVLLWFYAGAADLEEAGYEHRPEAPEHGHSHA